MLIFIAAILRLREKNHKSIVALEGNQGTTSIRELNNHRIHRLLLATYSSMENIKFN